MDSKQFRHLLGKYLHNRANDAEQVMVEFWYRSYEKDAGSINPRQQAFKAIMWKEIQRKSALPGQLRKLDRFRIGVAAAILIILSVSLVFQLQYKDQPEKQRMPDAYTSVSTLMGQLKYVILPDSSKVYLNANTKLRFEKHFNAAIREVFIDEGEAFFEVTHNVRRPFVVHAGQMSTRVLGTSFNIKAYRALKDFVVLVKTGKVQVNFKGKELGKLLVDQQIDVNARLGLFKRSENNALAYIKWQNKEVLLQGASFEELALLIKNNYGLKLIAADDKISRYTFSIPLNFASNITLLMQQISRIHHNKFKLKGDQLIMY